MRRRARCGPRTVARAPVIADVPLGEAARVSVDAARPRARGDLPLGSSRRGRGGGEQVGSGGGGGGASASAPSPLLPRGALHRPPPPLPAVPRRLAWHGLQAVCSRLPRPPPDPPPNQQPTHKIPQTHHSRRRARARARARGLGRRAAVAGVDGRPRLGRRQLAQVAHARVDVSLRRSPLVHGQFSCAARRTGGRPPLCASSLGSHRRRLLGPTRSHPPPPTHPRHPPKQRPQGGLHARGHQEAGHLAQAPRQAPGQGARERRRRRRQVVKRGVRGARAALLLRPPLEGRRRIYSRVL